MVFLGLSYKLKPARRVLFAGAVVFLLLAIIRYDFLTPGGSFQIDDSPLLFLISTGMLLFLLGLELVDRIHVRDELEIARQLQHDLLPHLPPQLAGYQFAFSYRTANEVGGDYYDFIPVDGGRMALVAGDASGHGIAAGLLMAIANATLKLALDLDPRPERVIRLLNKVLFQTGTSRAFMTLFVGLLDPSSGRLEYVCAGHPFPLLRHVNGELEEIGRGALPAGIRAELELSPAEVVIAPGETLVMYSDGIPEAVRQSTGADFGFDRLRHLIVPPGSPQEIHDRVLTNLDQFLAGEPRSDDVSLVVIRREATPPLPPPPAE
jgi:sigma-B regulation protein RsbU (phosphoserine phosphatase)